MHNPFNQPDHLRRRIAELESEVSTTEAEALPLANRMHAVSTAIDGADAVLRKPYSYPAHREAQEAKSAAYFERGELANQIQDNKRHIDTLKGRLAELRQTLNRAEYEGVTTTELRAKLSERISAISDLDSDIDVLTFERDTLQCKRLEAQQATTAVDSAERELQAARDAHDQTQGEAFISGNPVDLSAHVDRIEEAEKRLAGATTNATGGRAALPRISARLTAIEGERITLVERRGALVADYWHTRKRIVEVEYREQIQRTIQAGRRLAALDGKTGGRFGHDLIKSMREGLKQPVNGKSFEPVRIVDTDLVDVLAEFEAELSAALSG